jgi:hypothetical protein
MFLYLLMALLLVASLHASRLPRPAAGPVGELFLVYLLAGYCGVPMLAVSIGILVDPAWIAHRFPVGAPGPLLSFFGWAYLGMSLVAILALRLRGRFLIGPAVCWGVYLAGATLVHVHGVAGGRLGHGALLLTFATHGLVTVLLLVALAASGLLGRRA